MYEELEICFSRNMPEVMDYDNDVFIFPEYFESVIIPLLWGNPRIDDFLRLIDDAEIISKAGLSGVIIMSRETKRVYATSKEAFLKDYH